MARTAAASATLVAANDKLLKALITLLALRDKALIEDLRGIFMLAVRDKSEIGRADEAVWAHIAHELDVIAALAQDEEAPVPDGH